VNYTWILLVTYQVSPLRGLFIVGMFYDRLGFREEDRVGELTSRNVMEIPVRFMHVTYDVAFTFKNNTNLRLFYFFLYS
jgi:hypothetical protein